MQFAVPQFTDVEDKIIGPLTLKQFFTVMAAGGLIFLLWSIKLPGIIFFPIALVIGLIGVAVTFGKYNGRSIFVYVGPFLSFMLGSKAMVFRRDETQITVSTSELKANEQNSLNEAANAEPPASRLKKLAYLLDEKTEKEKQLTKG